MTQVLNNQAQALENLRSDVIEMMQMVLSQLSKAQRALSGFDSDLAQEIIHIEKKVNAKELSIDKACENILALYNPVAIDLRFVLAVININTQLERIGDHAEDIAEYITYGDINEAFAKETLDTLQFDMMFETAISVVDDAIYSFINEDTDIVKWVFGKDKTLNRINRESADNIAKLLEKKPGNVKRYLFLFSIMKKLERVGDLAKNIAEETVFYVDAKVIKHRKPRKKDKTK